MYTYAEVYTMSRNHPEALLQARLTIIKDLESGTSIREVARKYHASRNTVRRLWRRYQKEGIQALYNRS